MENDTDTKVMPVITDEDDEQAELGMRPPAPHEQEPAATEPPPPDAHCPNCNGPGIRKGKTIVCEKCNAAFRFTKEGPKVEELGPFDDHERRIANLEGKEVAEAPAVPAQPARPAEAPPGQVIAEDEDDGI